jgi:hypothetical protein
MPKQPDVATLMERARKTRERSKMNVNKSQRIREDLRLRAKPGKQRGSSDARVSSLADFMRL